MIIGVDHLALSAEDIDKGAAVLSGWGYKPKFINKDVANSLAKEPYLVSMNKYHDISYCQSAIGGPAVELTVHGSELKGDINGPYEIVFSGKNPGLKRDQISGKKEYSVKCEILSKIFDNHVKPIYLEDFKTIGYHFNKKEKQSNKFSYIICVLLKSGNLEKSSNFWRNLGFSEKMVSEPTEDHNWKMLEFKSHVPAWSLNLLLVYSCNQNNDGYKLDVPGFTCMALLTNNISKEIQRLRDDGIEVSDAFTLEVGGNPLKICLATGPDGECVELIQLNRRSNQ